MANPGRAKNDRFLTEEEIDAIFEEAKKRVHVACDEAEAHSALRGCVAPKAGLPDCYVTICMLVEHARYVNARLRELSKVAAREDEPARSVRVKEGRSREQVLADLRRLLDQTPDSTAIIRNMLDERKE